MSLSSRHRALGIGAPCRRISSRCGRGEGGGARWVRRGSRHLNPALRGDTHPSLSAAGSIRCPGCSGCARTEPLGPGISHINLRASGRSSWGKKVESHQKDGQQSHRGYVQPFGWSKLSFETHNFIKEKKQAPSFLFCFKMFKHLIAEAANLWEAH